jgi:transcriptional regulator of acetoin/glycerol metabolism
MELMFHLRIKRWPGNIRKLQNLFDRAVIVSQGGVLPNPLQAAETWDRGVSPDSTTLRGSERALNLRTLEATDWSLAGETAQQPDLV